MRHESYVSKILLNVCYRVDAGMIRYHMTSACRVASALAACMSRPQCIVIIDQLLLLLLLHVPCNNVPHMIDNNIDRVRYVII